MYKNGIIIRENKIEKYKKFAKCLLSNLSYEVCNHSLYRNDCAIYASIIYNRCCLVMGRRKGKTNFTLVHAIREAMIKGGRNIVIYVANESCVKICRERLAEMLNPLYLVSDTSNNRYNLVNGSSNNASYVSCIITISVSIKASLFSHLLYISSITFGFVFLWCFINAPANAISILLIGFLINSSTEKPFASNVLTLILSYSNV